ncbi:MAG TPA: three-Cys-motif partner protein TcmP [Candidatus Limnocylindrales bacterium]|nr:three-Cys-motif partner protein TcmP [Candidatus Limnocylindrales bacterium]
MPPKDALWPITPHTTAKHAILRAYLDAWIPIMDSQSKRLAIIDGFAGPGIYERGEPGSPVVMLRAFADHSHRGEIERLTMIEYLFVEKDAARFEWLTGQVAIEAARLPAHWPAPECVHGDFGEVVAPRIDALGQDGVPIFLFVDPFGYTDPPPELSKRLLSLRRCEVMTFVPTARITQFLGDEALAPTFDHFFGSRRWEDYRTIGAAAASRGLAELFKARLREDAQFVRVFEMATGDGRLYHLFFATNNTRGHEKMKEAMWRVDPTSGTRFSDATAPGQTVLFSETADLGVLEQSLGATFPKGEWLRYDKLERYTWDETPYLPKHLKADLDRLIKMKRAHAILRGPKGAFKPDTLVMLD